VNIANWIHGLKHPETPLTVFKNVWQWDLLRRKLKNRCDICNITLSDNEYKEIALGCKDGFCRCEGTLALTFKAHSICDVCYVMFHSLYINYSLADRNYFRNLDEKDREKDDDKGRRNRMGL
jgi:hypothetical protein